MTLEHDLVVRVLLRAHRRGDRLNLYRLREAVAQERNGNRLGEARARRLLGELGARPLRYGSRGPAVLAEYVQAVGGRGGASTRRYRLSPAGVAYGEEREAALQRRASR